MRNGNYRKGRNFEYLVKRKLSERGFLVIRSAGSHSPFDLIGVGREGVVLIQCKKGKRVDVERVKDEILKYRDWIPGSGVVQVMIAYSEGRGKVQFIRVM